MKFVRNMFAIAIVAASLTACSENAQNKSIGGSADTSDNISDVGATSVGGLDSTNVDTTRADSSKGNASPSGRP